MTPEPSQAAGLLPHAPISGVPASSTVSPGARDLRRKWAGVQQLGAGMGPGLCGQAGAGPPQACPPPDPALASGLEAPGRLALGLKLCLPDAEIPEVRGPAVGPLEGSGGPRGGTWGQCGDPLTTPVPRSPAVLADNVLPGPDDRGADTGHVQRTPAWPFSQQPRGPQAGHHQWDGGSRGRGEAQPPPTCQAVAPESQGAAPSPLPTPLLQVIPSYSSRTEYEKLFAMGVTM